MKYIFAFFKKMYRKYCLRDNFWKRKFLETYFRKHTIKPEYHTVSYHTRYSINECYRLQIQIQDLPTWMMFANVYINENISNVHNVLHCFLYQPGGVVSRRDGGVSWVHWGTSISLFRCSGHTKVKVRGLEETLGMFPLYIQTDLRSRVPCGGGGGQCSTALSISVLTLQAPS